MRPNASHNLSGRNLDNGRARGLLLVRIPGRAIEARPVGQEARHRAEHLGRFLERAQELLRIEVGRFGQRLPAAVDQHEPGAAFRQLGGRPCRDHGSCAVARQHDRRIRAREEVSTVGNRDRVLGQLARFVPVRWRIGEAVPAQVHCYDPAGAQPPCDRRPDPRGLREAVDQQNGRVALPDAGPRRGPRRPVPVEEVDPPARRDFHHEALGRRARIGCRDCRQIEVQRWKGRGFGLAGHPPVGYERDGEAPPRLETRIPGTPFTST